MDKYDVKINSVRWGSTPLNPLEDDNEHHQKINLHILDNPSLPQQPDLHLHIVIPNEFQPIVKKNIGMTLVWKHQYHYHNGLMQQIEWMKLFSHQNFQNIILRGEFDVQDKPGVVVKMNKPSSVLFEGVDTDIYRYCIYIFR